MNNELSNQIKKAAISMDEKEFTNWLHKQTVELAEYMESIGFPNAYENAKSFVLKSVKETTLTA